MLAVTLEAEDLRNPELSTARFKHAFAIFRSSADPDEPVPWPWSGARVAWLLDLHVPRCDLRLRKASGLPSVTFMRGTDKGNGSTFSWAGETPAQSGRQAWACTMQRSSDRLVTAGVDVAAGMRPHGPVLSGSQAPRGALPLAGHGPPQTAALRLAGAMA